MSLFGGGSKSAATTPTKALGIDFQSAQYGSPVPVVFGQNKLSGNCIWYGDFTATAHKQSTGGKGGGGSSSTSYTYSASFELGLCEGVANIVNVYDGSSTVSLSSAGGVVFTGTTGQAAWSHLTGAAALGYSGTALVAFQNKQLGSTASLPNYNFEMAGRNQFGSGIVDANPADIVNAICTDTQIGVNFSALGDLTAFKNYCTAAGIFFSPVYDTQNPAQQCLDDLIKYANCATYFSEGVLKIVPYCDETITGNGVTFTPNVTAIYDLGRDDFITNGPNDPVQIARIGPADAMNLQRVEFNDRSNTYHTSGVVASIDQDVVGTGARADQSDSVDMITTAAVARLVAQNLLQRTYYIRNTYTFQLSWRYCALEPMDVVTLTDANTGLYLAPVRITEVGEDEHGLLSITAEEFPEGVSHGGQYGTQPNAGTNVDANTDPGAIDGPYLFRGPGFLVSNAYPEIWAAISADSALWGGCDIYMSQDGTSYSYLSTTSRRASYGVLSNSLPSHTDPDSASAPNVLLNGAAQLLGGTTADADGFVTLSMVDTEIISYKTATLASGPSYTLGYLRRGGYGSTIAAHSAGAPFVRLDENIVRIPVDPSQIGQTVYLKFVSFNVFGKGGRTLAGETAYTYVIGTNVELPDIPVTPTSVVVQGVADGNSVAWVNPNPAAVGCTSIEYGTASGGPFTVLAQVGPTTTAYAHHFTNGATYYYRLRSRGPLVSAGWSAYTSVYSATGTNVNAIASTANNANSAVPLVNPNFLTDLSGWSLSVPADFSWVSNASTSPYAPIPTQMVHAGTAGQTLEYASNRTFNAVTPGEVVVAGCGLRAISCNSTAFATVVIDWLDSSGSYLSSSGLGSPTIGPGGTYLQGNPRISAVAPTGAASAGISIRYYNHTSGTITATGCYLNPQISSQDELPDGSTYLRSTSNPGSAVTIQNPNFELAYDAQGNIPGWGSINSGVLTLDTGTVYQGSQSLKTVNVGGGESGAYGQMFACDPGDLIAVRGYAYSASGSYAVIAVAFYSATNTRTGTQTVTGTSFSAWQQLATSASAALSAPGGTVKARLLLYQPTAGGVAFFDGLLVTRALNLNQHVRGTLPNQSYVPNITFGSVRSLWSASTVISGSYSTATPAIVTLNVTAGSLYAGSQTYNYNASSGTVSQARSTTANYYLYYLDPGNVGGTQTLYISTTSPALAQNDALIFIGSISITVPASGSGSGGTGGGGGGGGGGCVCVDQWLPGGLQAGAIEAGDVIYGTEGDLLSLPFQVNAVRINEQPCWQLVTESDATVSASDSTPMTLPGGDLAWFPDMLGELVAVRRGDAPAQWERVTQMRYLGMRQVNQISIGGNCYWAGDVPGIFISTHNSGPAQK